MTKQNPLLQQCQNLRIHFSFTGTFSAYGATVTYASKLVSVGNPHSITYTLQPSRDPRHSSKAH